jgi:REP element-mobilizing transposase RayT
VWSTKDRQKIITPKIEAILYPFLYNQFKELNCPTQILNGMPDHIHCLFLLDRSKSIAEVLKQVKGSSSHYINQHNLKSEKFAWQTGYGAFSISESGVQKVYDYIKHQKEHHRLKTFEEEYRSFLSLYGFTES